jgi:4-amino-4-deoxy-L-arabinose transferase-like glycosyltransferase
LTRRPLAALLAVSALVKLVYVFALTDYPRYLFSDFWGYWSRALERLGGNELGASQWAIWPPLPHIVLSWYLRAVDLAGLTAWRLEAVLAANVAMSTASVALVYGIAEQALQRRKWALAVATLYAFTFPLIYFNAFVMSEHLSTLCMLASLWLALRFRASAGVLLAAGLLLGLASAQRPAFGLFGLAFFAYIAAAGGSGRHSLLRAVAFSLGFALVVGAAALEAQRISSGRVAGLGANGGINFYFSHCRPHQVIARYNNEDYSIVAPALADRPENGSMRFDRPVHDQRFFTGLGWQCLREQPDVLAGGLERFRNLFFGPLLPTAPSARGFDSLLPVFRWLLFFCALALPLAAFVRRESGVRPDALALLGGLLALAAAGLYIFSAEHRYLYPLAAPLYIVCAAIVLTATRERRMARLAATWAGALGAIFLGAAALQALLRPDTPPVAATIYRFAAPLVSSAALPESPLSSFRIGSLRYETAERLWKVRHGEPETYAVFRACMNVREPGLYEFLVVSDESYTLDIDAAQLTRQHNAGMTKALGGRRQLTPGKHPYVLRLDRAVGARATWRRLASPRHEFRPGLGLHYIGESAAEAEFLPPEQCSAR